jgi:hypothetical protein
MMAKKNMAISSENHYEDFKSLPNGFPKSSEWFTRDFVMIFFTPAREHAPLSEE